MTPASSLPTPPVRWLLSLGGALTVLGVYLVVRSSWSDLAPVARMLLVLVPLIATYAMAWSANKREATRSFVDELLLTAGLILPFSVGAALVQVGAFEGWTSLLTFSMAMLTLAVAKLLNIVWGQDKQSALVALSAIVASISLGSHLSAPLGWHLIALAVIGLGLLGLGIWKGVASAWERTSYHRIGMSLFVLGGFIAPFALTMERGINIGLTYFLGYASFGILALAIAASIGKRYEATLPDTLLYEHRTLAEWSAGIALSAGMLLAGTQGTAGEIIAGLVVSLGLLALGYSIPFRPYRFLGGAASVLLVFVLLIDTLDDLLAYWPVALVTLGIGAMWYALRIAGRQTGAEKEGALSTGEPWNNIGKPLPQPAIRNHADDAHPDTLAGGLPYPPARGEKSDSTSGWASVGILIGILLFLSIL